MFTYAVEVCAVIGLAVVSVAVPVTVIGFGFEALRSALSKRRPSLTSSPLPSQPDITGEPARL